MDIIRGPFIKWPWPDEKIAALETQVREQAEKIAALEAALHDEKSRREVAEIAAEQNERAYQDAQAALLQSKQETLVWMEKADSAIKEATKWVQEATRLARYAPTDGDLRSTEELAVIAAEGGIELWNFGEGWCCAKGSAGDNQPTLRAALRKALGEGGK